jgi:hypothetical protein
MQHIVTTLLTRGEHPAHGEHISFFAPFFEIDKSWDAATGQPNPGPLGAAPAGGRRVFNTHLRWSQMPRRAGCGARYIYVVRDGRDAVASFFFHLSNQADSGGFEGTFADFFDGWLCGALPYGTWIDHVKSWLLRKGPAKDSVLVVHYADLKADLEAQLRRINGFLRLPLLDEAAELPRLAAAVSFAHMKRHMDRFQPRSVAWKPGYEFIRRGESGDGAQLLTPDQHARFKAALEAEFPESILSFKPSYLA